MRSVKFSIHREVHDFISSHTHTHKHNTTDHAQKSEVTFEPEQAISHIPEFIFSLKKKKMRIGKFSTSSL